MGITTVTQLTAGTAGGGATATTASITPPANSLILAYIDSWNLLSNPGTVALTGNGLTWTDVNAGGTNWHGTIHRGTLFRASGSAPTTGAITITTTGTAPSEYDWVVIAVDGVILTNNNGVVQKATNTGTAVTSLTATLASFSNTNNSTIGVFAVNNDNSTITPGSGFTGLTNQSPGAFDSYKFIYKTANDTTVDATFASADSFAIGLEIASFNRVSGSFTADTNLKKTISASFTANAYVGGGGLITCDAVFKRNGRPKTFTADAYFRPVATTITATPDATNGYAVVKVLRAATGITSSNLYRINPITADVVLVRSDNPNFIYNDVGAPFEKMFNYRLDDLDSTPAVIATTTISCALIDCDYWAVGSDLNGVQFVSVFNAQYTRTRQQESFAILNADYKEVQSGLLLGEGGTVQFTAPTATAQSALRTFMSTANYAGKVFLKSPWGEVWRVAIGGPNVTYHGTGHITINAGFIKIGAA